MSLFHRLICPLDQLPLEHKQGALCCIKGHSFDIAKSGYINLLPVQKKQSKDPGDSKEMVSARRNFLNTGIYEPIADGIFSLINAHSLEANNAPFSLLDAGCGEGYYLSYLQNKYEETLIESVGLDISKWAVAAASKRNKKLSWVVGSNANLPMPKHRFDGVLCLFGFPVWSEFHRVLKEDGYVLLANAGADHLLELREILYPEIRPHKPTSYHELDGFTVVKEETIKFQFTVSSQEELMKLVQMTPHLYKASYEGKQTLAQTHQLTITVDVTLTHLQKTRAQKTKVQKTRAQKTEEQTTEEQTIKVQKI